MQANTKPLTFQRWLVWKTCSEKEGCFSKAGLFSCFLSLLKARRRENGDSQESAPESDAPWFFIGHQLVFEFLTRRHNPILSRHCRTQAAKAKQQISINGNCDSSPLLCSRVHRWDAFASRRRCLWRPCLRHFKYLIPLNIL